MASPCSLAGLLRMKLGPTLTKAGDFERAAALFEESASLYEGMGGPDELACYAKEKLSEARTKAEEAQAEELDDRTGGVASGPN